MHFLQRGERAHEAKASYGSVTDEYLARTWSRKVTLGNEAQVWKDAHSKIRTPSPERCVMHFPTRKVEDKAQRSKLESAIVMAVRANPVLRKGVREVLAKFGDVVAAATEHVKIVDT
jgi:hypothetical protein